jgi:hypothetical protein
MCFELDSEPPIPRISGAAVSHDDLVLESEDGNRFAAFRALPEAGSGGGPPPRAPPASPPAPPGRKTAAPEAPLGEMSRPGS